MKKPVGLENNEISIGTAVDRISRYANTMTAIVDIYNEGKPEEERLPTDFVKGFWIPKDDIEGLYNMAAELRKLSAISGDVNGCRVYLGMDENYQMTLSINATEFGSEVIDDVEVELSKDIIVDGLVAENGVGLDETSTGIFDFIEPCPENCDPNSVLMEPYATDGECKDCK
ncbi:hypothetical protein [Neptunitalea lumnitzerae]|uniref:Uncharacterized protein n=1 Tax=Neptunitalea lumnitzerae TaxID=2965509 RepID=A0ABQ5MFS4_9FLAO|nr:hypothetical protein [Neptunitalea sp. Y10]GLB48250.1 hypothetical protein Y10_06180 [Neptunitalea sp. Y10]